MLPRADVSNASLAAALVGLVLLLTTGTLTLAGIAVFATVIVQAGLTYALPEPYKLAANFIGGALVTVAVGAYSIVNGLPYDAAALQQEATALTLFILNILIPARQP